MRTAAALGLRTREAHPANGDDPLPVDVGRDLDVDDRSGSPGADAARDHPMGLRAREPQRLECSPVTSQSPSDALAAAYHAAVSTQVASVPP